MNNRVGGGIFYIPDGKMIGKLEEVKDYDTRNHRMQTTYQNTHFLKQFGRNDFKDIATQDDISEAAKYITKYMEKSGERLVYGGKLQTYFRSEFWTKMLYARSELTTAKCCFSITSPVSTREKFSER